MALAEDPYRLQELCDLAGVTQRTVRYYIQSGLLPSPGRQGPGTRYGQGHLDRLRLIRARQGEHRSLAEIRGELDAMSDRDVAAALRSKGATPRAARNQALAYLEGLVTKPGTGEVVPLPVDTASWERLTLAEGIELHVKRPLPREQQERLDRLIQVALKILDRGGSIGDTQ